jgi:hypothetical protein
VSVRREIGACFEFGEPQATHLTGLCGVASARIAQALESRGIPSFTARLKLRLGDEALPSHVVVIADGRIVDGTITQFMPGARFATYATREVARDQFCFSAQVLAPWMGVPGDVAPPEYPLGRLVFAERTTVTPESTYACRSYMLLSFVTQFATNPGELKTITPLVRAYETGDVEWRRTVAAGLEEFAGVGSREAIALAERLLSDDDDVVRPTAQRHHAALTELGFVAPP